MTRPSQNKPKIDAKLLKPYNPEETESAIYRKWEESGFFNPDECVKKGVTKKESPAFSIIMPPPNVTGILHMGHALTLTLEDIMIRYKRMRGFKTLWLPGTDHAAIATQAVVEKELYKKEGKSRHDLGREAFLKRIETFAEQSRNTIVSQIRVMGASCDWSREAFTLDGKRSLAVRTMFKKMYDDGLIYRGCRIINWDPKGQTTISDDEIVYEERKTKLYTFRYGEDFPIPIATTRPETKLGDVAVAVHPDDTRYKKYIGKTFEIADFAGVRLVIKVVADREIDPKFGTGAVGVTPAHSQTDADIADRHNLDKTKIVINEQARMINTGKPTEGKKVSEAREIVVSWLKEKGLLEKEEEFTHNVATAERTGGIIEPLPKLQWFVDVNKPIKARGGKTLKDLMREPVESGEIRIIPEHFIKTYFHWIDNLRDWCISRQIWYGHRIPVWYRKTSAGRLGTDAKQIPGDAEEIYVGTEAPEGKDWEQDSDTLDTWFSSGLWTFSTLGWPGETADLNLYHPTSVLETGYEILFFWVARMILMTEYALGQIPFRVVYLNGTVRDNRGRKMSKSLGNGIDPIDVAKKFGTDAGRMSLVIGNTPGTDMALSENKIKGYKHFVNKLWNITRFVLENTSAENPDVKPTLTKTDDKRLQNLKTLAREITGDMESFRFHLAAEKLYHYVWHEFADKIIEEKKAKLKESGDSDGKKSAAWLLRRILETSLILLHPFIPFVTEEIWTRLGKKNFLMVERWPEPDDPANKHQTTA